MEVEQPGKVIRLHLDSYIQEVLAEHKAYIKKALRTKEVPMYPALVLTNEDCSITPDPRKQKYYRSCASSSCTRPRRYPRPKSTTRRRRRRRFCTSVISSKALLRPAFPDSGVRGQHRVHRVGKQRHWWSRAREAHRHPEALRSCGDPEWSYEADPRRYLPATGGHLDQAASWQACVAGILGNKIVTTT